jgi:hypothetical protein
MPIGDQALDQLTAARANAKLGVLLASAGLDGAGA